MKYIFAFNHYNYARWLSIQVDDLLKLEYKCPDVYKEFCNEHFVISKTGDAFSSIALDQAHRQNNAVLKATGGAAGLLTQDIDAALRPWEIVCREVVRLLSEYEKCHNIGPEIDNGKRHGDYPAFHEIFFTDVNNLFNCFKDICNPFEDNELIDLNTCEVVTSEIQSCLGNLLEKYHNFRKHRLIVFDVAITATTKNNALLVQPTIILVYVKYKKRKKKSLQRLLI